MVLVAAAVPFVSYCLAAATFIVIMSLQDIPPRCNAFSMSSIQRQPSKRDRLHSLPLLSHSTSSEEQPLLQKNVFPDTKPFNLDIARTIFAPLFFSMRHHQNSEQSPSTYVRHHYQRPSPFEDPSSAQTAERMLRRMMENRYRSDGRTVCPDNTTFTLVSGAFGRLRCGRRVGRTMGSASKGESYQKMITWEEETNINPQYQNNTSNYWDDAPRVSKVQVTTVDKLQQLLQLQLRLCHREGWPTEIRPSLDMYNRILKRLAWQSGRFRTKSQHCNEISAAEQSWLWLQLMKSHLPWKQIIDEDSCICQPNAMSYAHVIEALSAHRVPVPSESEKGFRDPPDNLAYESIESFAQQLDIDMISSAKPRNSPEWFLNEAEGLLAKLEDEYGTAEDEKSKHALAHSYRCLLDGWGRYTTAKYVGDQKKRQCAINRAHELLCCLEGLANNSDVPSSCYVSVILALSVSDLPSAANVAEGVLQRLIEIIDKNCPSVLNVKDLSTAFSGCIAAHAKNNDAPKAEKILNQMIDLYHDGKLGSAFVPEVRAFGTCIALWSKYSPANVRTDEDKGGQRAKRRGKHDFLSNEQRLYNADRAEAILSELESVANIESSNDNSDFVLHATPYNIAILARVHSIGASLDSEQSIHAAQSILDHMEYDIGVSPDPYTYSILLNAWCQQARPGNEKAADYAEALLRRRIEDVDISKIFGDDVADEIEEPTQGEIWPNVKHYSSVLKAHAKTKSAGGAKKALGLLSEMEQRFYSANIISGADDTANASDDYHVDQKDAAKPDIVCYSIVIDAFANSRLPEASSVAYRLLRAVETKYDAGDISMKPNSRIYTAVIKSFVHSPIRDSEDDGDSLFKHTNNAVRAWSILERMKDNDALPNSFTYNYIINCAAEAGSDAEGKRTSFEVALRAFQELRNSRSPDCQPDSFTFAFMLKACSYLLPPGPLRNKVIAQTFRECCSSGYLNDAVLERLWQGIPPKTFFELIELDQSDHVSAGKKSLYHTKSPPIPVTKLPDSWSRCCGSYAKRGHGKRKVRSDGAFR